MKKSIFAFLFIFMFYGTAFAEKEEWIDKDYNFSNAKAIDVEYCVSENLCNGIKEKETTEIFQEKFVAMLNKKSVFAHKACPPFYTLITIQWAYT